MTVRNSLFHISKSILNNILGLVILCFVREVLTRQEAGAIKDFATLVAKTFALPDTSFEDSERLGSNRQGFVQLTRQSKQSF